MTLQTAGKNGLSENHTPSTPECDLVGTAPRPRMQFDMQSLMWLTATIGIALMYIRPSGQNALLGAGLVITLAVLMGALFGAVSGKIADVMYWAVLGAAFAFVSTATARLVHWTTPYAWAVTGMVTGCVVGSCSRGGWLRCMVAGGISATVTMGVYIGLLYQLTGRFELFDVASCLPIGAFFGLLVLVLRQVQRQSHLRYDAVATLLMAAIVVGNYLARWVAPYVILAIVIGSVSGCGQAAPTADPAPFEAAVTKYLDQHDMALQIKRIRQGPTIEGERATMSASMTSRDVGGPSVAWTFQFERHDADGAWRVVSHAVN